MTFEFLVKFRENTCKDYLWQHAAHAIAATPPAAFERLPDTRRSADFQHHLSTLQDSQKHLHPEETRTQPRFPTRFCGGLLTQAGASFHIMSAAKFHVRLRVPVPPTVPPTPGTVCVSVFGCTGIEGGAASNVDAACRWQMHFHSLCA